MNRDNVKSTFFGCDMNVKKAIDALDRQDMNEGDETDTKECSETCSIDEWSDGDEKIRAKNKAKKEAKKKSKNFSDESTASSSISANSSSTNENKKRKNAEKIGKRLIIFAFTINYTAKDAGIFIIIKLYNTII